MDKTQTFADIGIPFRLYKAPIETCSDFKGRGTCSICARDEQWIFDVGLGDSLIVACSNCQTNNALSYSDKTDVNCSNCATVVAWPISNLGEVLVCYDCLRAGRVAFTQDTDFGMIRWQDTRDGLSHGIPGPSDSSFASESHTEFEPMTGGNVDWHRYALPREDMEELNRTPSYITCQGERWPFHCGRAMVYLGEPTSRPQEEVASEIAEATLALARSDGWDFPDEEIWDSLIYIYLFRCPVCGAFGGHTDSD